MNSEVGSTVRQPDAPAEEAFFDLAGDVVRAIAPRTEASQAALLSQTLASFGNVTLLARARGESRRVCNSSMTRPRSARAKAGGGE